MPIYAYRCETCGFKQDVLRKMSDPLLVDCPSCGAATFRKQVTAAGFQLKGSGWYVTDFRNPATKEAASTATSDSDSASKSEAAPDSGAKSPEASKPSAETAAPKAAVVPTAAKAAPPPAGTGR